MFFTIPITFTFDIYFSSVIISHLRLERGGEHMIVAGGTKTDLSRLIY